MTKLRPQSFIRDVDYKIHVSDALQIKYVYLTNALMHLFGIGLQIYPYSDQTPYLDIVANIKELKLNVAIFASSTSAQCVMSH